MNSLGHFIEIGALFQAVLGVGIDTVGALNRVGHGQGDQRLLPSREGPVLEDGAVPLEELLRELGRVLADLGELGQVGGVGSRASSANVSMRGGSHLREAFHAIKTFPRTLADRINPWRLQGARRQRAVAGLHLRERTQGKR